LSAESGQLALSHHSRRLALSLCACSETGKRRPNGLLDVNLVNKGKRMYNLRPAPGPDPHRYRALAPRAPDGLLDLAALLPGDGPIELEIGFGHGLFLYERAAACPQTRILGLEIKKKWATLVAQRCAQRGLTHVTAWSDDARLVLPRVSAESVTRVFMNFPDPWWKRRHAKRRLTGDTLLDAIVRVLAPGGELFMQTDVAEAAARHLDALAGHPQLELRGDRGHLAENPYGARSNREARAFEDGLPVYRTLAVKCAAPA
jgi:tRNA (guanine-N7-)-methyltransferase